MRWESIPVAHRTPTTSRRGFTLIESLLASTLLAVSVVGIGGLLAATHQNDAHTQRRTQLIRSARAAMEAAAAVNFDSTGGPFLGDLDGRTDTDSAGNEVRYEVVYGPAPATIGGTGTFASVTVAVTAPDGTSIVLRRFVGPDYLQEP